MRNSRKTVLCLGVKMIMILLFRDPNLKDLCFHVEIQALTNKMQKKCNNTLKAFCDIVRKLYLTLIYNELIDSYECLEI